MTTTTHNPNDCPRLCSTPRGCLLGDRCPHRQGDEGESVEKVRDK
jgi:ABC-type antimicrobial peptide transport system ATPase subunit